MYPTEIKVPADRRSLKIAWPDGLRQQLKATTLRRLSRSAQSESTRIAGRDIEIAEDLTIQSVEPVGVYAINVRFSDGYAKAIYPWDLLRSAIGAVAFMGMVAKGSLPAEGAAG